MCRKTVKWLGGCVLLLLLWWPGRAAALESWEFGLRGGMDATALDENYTAGEIYLLRTLPWQAELGAAKLLTRIDLGAGYLEAANDHGGWLAAGADLVCLLGGGAEIEAGFRPAWLIDHIYGDDDFGGDLQFVSHGGIGLHAGHFVLSYRFQHLSNASIYNTNDGLDLHLFGVGARF